ncbi:MAG: Hsp70 family protein [Ardenticatenales bacterium]|nr:Hsp70 family protein [Ardenticatenales bacterium]MCB9171580.1 Hsp70 family protein [Ardenticatenales bacterium]
MSDKILGIDLGTTNSAVAIIQAGRPALIPVEGEAIMPSVVGMSDEGELLVGYAARNQWVAAPQRTVRSIKRSMGSADRVEMAGADYSPQEISAFILRKLKESVAAQLGEAVTRAVITVPAYFTEPQRQATIEAGAIAGLEVERIINEPTAAALAYNLVQDADAHVLVYDLGGGTFDVSVIEMNAGVVDVRATAGDNHLGGDDFDLLLAEMLADEFEDEYEIDLRQQHGAWARLLRAAEEAKIELSDKPYALIALEYIAEDGADNPLHIRREVTRDEFERLIDELVERTLDFVEKALDDAGLTVDEIDRVLMVGGSTRIPLVWQALSQQMGQSPHTEIDPDLAVALGAAIQGGIIAGEAIDAILVDVTPHSLGIESARHTITGQLLIDQFSPLVRRNTTVPVEKSEVFSTLFPGQTALHIKVYQGEASIASQNVLLGDFKIEALQPNRPDGLTDVTVNFRLDVNGILDVTVVERVTGQRVSERLKASQQRLSPSQIAESQRRLDAAEAPAQIADEALSALVARAERALDTLEMDEDTAEDFRDVLAALRAAYTINDSEEVDELTDELVDLLFEVEE